MIDQTTETFAPARIETHGYMVGEVVGTARAKLADLCPRVSA